MRAGELDDLLRERHAVHARESWRQAEAFRIILAVVIPTFCKERLRPGQHHDVVRLQIGAEVEVVFDVGLPDAGEVHGARRRARRRGFHIDPAVGRRGALGSR